MYVCVALVDAASVAEAVHTGIAIAHFLAAEAVNFKHSQTSLKTSICESSTTPPYAPARQSARRRCG